MKVLVVGSGGREHAICWKFVNEKEVNKVFCAPGNFGMKGVERVAITDYDALANFAEEEKIDLTVIGPEVPLCDGIVDIFRAKGLAVFGPDKEAAMLEGSKDFSKEFMFKYDIPTAKSKTFTNEKDALNYLRTQEAPIVVKADGLAAGKGVTVALQIQEAEQAVKGCFAGSFGEAGYKLIIENFLDGEEASIFAFLDGHCIKALASSQDHKRAYDNDEGPNTGGMGTYSPAPVVTDEVMKKVDSKILQPILRGVKAEGLDYRGIIFVGIMICKGEPKVLEFNVRFGDPETQSVLMRMKSSLFEAMNSTVNGQLSSYDFEWYTSAACCVVMASGGYPASYQKGLAISGLDDDIDDVVIFHAGTDLNDAGKFVNMGGRVLGITAKGGDIRQAVDLAYERVSKINWQGCFYRKDIANRALK